MSLSFVIVWLQKISYTLLPCSLNSFLITLNGITCCNVFQRLACFLFGINDSLPIESLEFLFKSVIYLRKMQICFSHWLYNETAGNIWRRIFGNLQWVFDVLRVKGRWVLVSFTELIRARTSSLLTLLDDVFKHAKKSTELSKTLLLRSSKTLYPMMALSILVSTLPWVL